MGREVEHREGELTEIEVIQARRHRLVAQGKAKTLDEDLIISKEWVKGILFIVDEQSDKKRENK